MCEGYRVTEPIRDPRKMHKRIGMIIDRQIRALQRAQKKNGSPGLSVRESRMLTSLNAALDDHIRLGRQLDQWDEEAAETLTDQELEALADGKKPVAKRETKQERPKSEPKPTEREAKMRTRAKQLADAGMRGEDVAAQLRKEFPFTPPQEARG